MDSDEENEEVPSWKGIPATIILINIFDNSKNRTAEMAHLATSRVIRQCLRLSNSQYMGVCLYGTEDISSSLLNLKGIHEIFPLTLPTLEDFKKIQNTNITTLNVSKELILSDALWYCSKMFAKCKKQLSSRTILILSRLDILPTQSDQKPSLLRVVDLVDSNIKIQIINVSEDDYEVDPFYKTFLMEANKGKEIILPKPVWKSQEIEQLMYQHSNRHLAVAHLNFELGDGLAIGVGVYNLLKSSSYGSQKTSNLDRETNALLTSVTKTLKVTPETTMDIDEDGVTSQVPLLKSEVLYYKEFGGERVEFTNEEMKALKNPFGPPMLKLLGFKPANVMCKEKWAFNKNYFIFPSEQIIEGSTVAFKALHQACSEMSVVAICILCTRINARPLIVALVPCTRPLDQDVELGFDVVPIPFMEDLRDVPVFEEDEEIRVSEAHKTVMKDILNSLNFDYKPAMFQNPKLQSQYRAIEAIALEDDEVESFVDTTQPDPKVFKNVKEDYFNELFGPFGSVATKRATEVTDEPSFSKKKANMSSLEENLLQKHLIDHTVDKYTVAQLKEILKNKNVPGPLTGLKKNELVELVYEHCA